MVYSDVKAMGECCQDMTDRLKASKSQTRDLINQTTQLQTERRVAECYYYYYTRMIKLPSYGLARSITGVSIIALGWGSVNLSHSFTHYPMKLIYSSRERRGGSLTTMDEYWIW